MSNKYIDSYIKYRLSLNDGTPENVVKWIQRDLQHLAPNDETKQGLICKQSLDNGWKGLYPLKPSKKTNNSFNNFPQREEVDLDELINEEIKAR